MTDSAFKWQRYVLILVVALAVLFVVRIRENKYTYREEMLLNFQPDEIVSITVSNGGKSLNMSLQDSLWVFQEPDTGFADSETVGTFLAELAKAVRGNYVAKGENLYRDYGLSDDQAVHLILFREGEIAAEVFSGHSSSDRNRNNVRYPGDDRIFQTGSRIDRFFSESAKYWR